MTFLLPAANQRALTALVLPLVLAACGNGSTPTPSHEPTDADASYPPDAPSTTPDADEGGAPPMDASTAASRGRIGSGTGFSCALDESGTVVCWGPQFNNTRAPTKSGFTWIAAGGVEACAIDGAGEIVCWDSRSIAAGAVVRNVPAGPFVEVAIGSRPSAEYACARRASGEIACWRSSDLPQRPELTTPPAGALFARVALGANAACGLQMNGTLLCWGSGSVTSNVPSSSFNDLAVDEFLACAIDSAGRPTCWGIDSPYFATNFPPGQRSVQIAGSSYADLTCSVLGGGTVFCADQALSYPSPSSNKNIVEVAMAEDHYCVVMTDRSVACQLNSSTNPFTPPAGLHVLAR